MVFGSARTYCITFGWSRPVQCARISSPLYSFLTFSYFCTDHSHPGAPPVTPVVVVVVFVVIVDFVFVVVVVVVVAVVVIVVVIVVLANDHQEYPASCK